MNAPRLILGPMTGGLTSTSTNLWGRADKPATLYGWISQNPELADAVQAGETKLEEDDGCTGIIPVRNLSPETIY
jgi:phosphodiesterase/alkaline phosphatase D-like protein